MDVGPPQVKAVLESNLRVLVTFHPFTIDYITHFIFQDSSPSNGGIGGFCNFGLVASWSD